MDLSELGACSLVTRVTARCYWSARCVDLLPPITSLPTIPTLVYLLSVMFMVLTDIVMPTTYTLTKKFFSYVYICIYALFDNVRIPF